ncbi:MAG TPA: tetratricopeptide repeat protein [Candidatus Acidoferrales bacterium]|nr:tetratricopeptide repeat protein [Candidatus Acidoferrales bacterium]
MRRLIGVLTLSIVALGCGESLTRPPADVRLDTLADKRAAFAQAYASFHHGDLQRALPIFSALVTSYPELADYHLYFVGVINERLGQDAAAQAVFYRLVNHYPQSTEAPAAALAVGELQMRAAHLDESRLWLENALAAPDAGTAQAAREALAEVDEQSGNVAAAYAGFMQVRRDATGSKAARTAKQHVVALRAAHPELAPTGFDDRLQETKLLIAEHDYDAARSVINGLSQPADAVVVPEKDSRLLRVLADLLFAMGETDRALAVLRKLVDNFPATAAAPDALLRLAAVRWNRDDDEAALQAFEEFRRRYPQESRAAEALYAIGRIHERAGRTPEAIAAYGDLAAHYPHATLAGEAQWRIGWIHYLAGEWTAAAVRFSELAQRTESARERTEALYWQARSRDRLGRSVAASELYREIIDRDPGDYYAMWAERRLGVASDPPATGGAITAPEPAVPSPAPSADPFYVGRWQELKAAGVYSLARGALAALERSQRDDPATAAYLLRAYQTVDGYAAALHLLHHLDGSADLSSSEREHLLYPLAFWTLVQPAAQANGVDPLLIESIMRQESLFDPDARSSADARGLMQVMPGTAQRVAAGDARIDPTELSQPDINIELGVRELTGLLARFHGDVLKAVAAYNGGAAAVEKWERRAPELDTDEFVESISFRETRDYVKRVVSNYRTYRQLYVATAN